MAKRKVNKSQAIRDHFEREPDASPQEVAKTLKVTPALVYNVKSNMQAGHNGKRKVRKKKKVRRKKAVASTPSRNLDDVMAAARLIRDCGGIEQARQALKAAAQVAEAIES